MLIVSLVLAVIGLAALVFAVITSNELVAWVCIGASALGVILLIVDALQERRRRDAGPSTTARESDDHDEEAVADYPADENGDGDAGHQDSVADDSVSDEHNSH